MESYISSDRLFVERYRIDSKLGEGGMGAVYLAWDTRLERWVAITVLPALAEPIQFERFVREAKAIARLSHPNIIALFDNSDCDGLPYMVMEYVKGQPLNRTQFTTLEPLLGAAEQICDALEYAHANEVIHRDIKPENVIYTTTGQIKVLDFGLAMFQGAKKVTQTGLIAGTFPYLSPELICGAKPTPSSDQYALAVVLYELLCGGFPFPVDQMETSFRHRISQEAVPLATYRPDLPGGLLTVLERSLRRDPRARFASMAEMKQALVAVRLSLPGAASESGLASAAGYRTDSEPSPNGFRTPQPAPLAAATLDARDGSTGPVDSSSVATTAGARRWLAAVLAIAGLLVVGTVVGLLIARHWNSRTKAAQRGPESSSTQRVVAPKPDPGPRTPPSPRPTPQPAPPGTKLVQPGPLPLAPRPTQIPTTTVPPKTAPPATTTVLSPSSPRWQKLAALVREGKCGEIRKLALTTDPTRPHEVTQTLAFYQQCRMTVLIKQATQALHRGECEAAVRLYGAALPQRLHGRKDAIQRFRNTCERLRANLKMRRR